MKRLLLGGILVTVAVVVWVALRGDPDLRAIRKNFGELVQEVQLDAREDLLHAGLAARRISGRFTDDVAIEVKGLPFSITSRTDLQTALVHVRSRLDRLEVATDDVQTELSEDRASAEMILSAKVSAEGMGEVGEERRGVQIDWRSTEEGWKISGISSFETIR